MFNKGPENPPTDALRPINPDNACIPCITAAAGTELADAYSSNTIALFLKKRCLQPISFLPPRSFAPSGLTFLYPTHCGKFLTAASRGSLGRVSVPMWLIILSEQLLIIALVGRYPKDIPPTS